MLEGGRGKSGLVRRLNGIADFREARRLILATLDDADTPLLLEEAVPIAREIFVAVRVDGTRQRLELLLAAEGGEDVERSAKKLARVAIEPGVAGGGGAHLSPRQPNCFRATWRHDLPVTPRACRTSPSQEDLQLFEINPLALTDRRPLHRLRRQAHPRRSGRISPRPERVCAEPHARRARHDSAGARPRATSAFNWSRPLGDVVLVTSGAGLAMMMMDLLADHGLRAASFMDNLRGAPDETMNERLKIARALAKRPGIKAIVFQTVIASRSLAERIDALTAWIKAEPLPKPLFVGLAAGHAATRKMSPAAAIEQLGALGVPAFTDPVALVRAVARTVAQ